MRVQLCTAVRYFWAFLLVIFSVAIIQYNSDVPNFSFSSQSSVIKLPNDKLNFTFTYLITPDRLCQSESNDKSSIQLVVIVKSRVESSDNRQSIRETWGEVAAERNIPVIFVVAANNHSQSDLLTESHRHGDILQADLIDSYHNLSLKVLSLLAWEAERCGNGVNYYFHTDDDCIVIIPHLLDYIKRRFPVGRHNRILHGHCWIGGSKVARNQSNHKK